MSASPGRDTLKVPPTNIKTKGKPGRKSHAELEAQRIARGDKPSSEASNKPKSSKKRPIDADGIRSSNETERQQNGEKGAFMKDLVEMMYGCGDVFDPDPAALQLVDQLLTEHLASLIAAAMNVVPNKRDRLNPDNFLYVMRQWPEKHAKCEKIIAKYQDDASSKKRKIRIDDNDANVSPRPIDDDDL